MDMRSFLGDNGMILIVVNATPDSYQGFIIEVVNFVVSNTF